MTDRLAIAVMSRLTMDAAALSGTPVRLAVVTPRGLVRGRGVVLAADRAGIVEVELTDDVAIDQRREHVRVAAQVPGLVAPRDAARPPLHTFTLDVSGGGILVAGAGPVEVGTPVAVTVKLPDRDALSTDARIARRTGDGYVGLVFEGITETDREELVRWIFERQRLERRAARESG
jgi:c-di-GMP-binding flagellar brake protein YcgR